tara:strand:+ start:5945 stop:6832 length:888 start_codon:yes stop_codon:yes gene_type:complete
MKSLSLQFLKFLSRLCSGDEIPGSQVGRSWPISGFEDCGALSITRKGRGRTIAGDRELIAAVLNTRWSIPEIDKAIRVMEDEEASKGERGMHVGHTKAGKGESTEERRVRVRAANEEAVFLEFGEDRIEIPRLSGVTIGLPWSCWGKSPVSTPKGLVAIICENIENFHGFNDRIARFYGLTAPCLVFWRSHKQPVVASFLDSLGVTQVFYYCDFDLAGVFIYENEILKFHPDAQLLIPENLSEMIERKGNPDLYNQQSRKYQTFTPSTEDGRKVAAWIRDARKGLEQETLDATIG